MAVEAESLTFGNLLRHYRLAAGWTQQELADRAGHSRRGVDDLERGVRRAPYRDTVQRLVKALSLSEQDVARLEATIARAHGRLVVLALRHPDAVDGETLLPPLRSAHAAGARTVRGDRRRPRP